MYKFDSKGDSRFDLTRTAVLFFTQVLDPLFFINDATAAHL